MLVSNINSIILIYNNNTYESSAAQQEKNYGIKLQESDCEISIDS